MSLKAGASAGGWFRASVGAAGKGFQGLDGQRRRSLATLAPVDTPGFVEGLAPVVSSSEDSSLPTFEVGGGTVDFSPCLSGVQPGGRRLPKI